MEQAPNEPVQVELNLSQRFLLCLVMSNCPLLRTLAAFYSFLILGMNDGAIGVSQVALSQIPLPNYSLDCRLSFHT